MLRKFLLSGLIFVSLCSCIQYPVNLEKDLVSRIDRDGDTYIVFLDGKHSVDTVVLEEAFDAVKDFEIAARIGDDWKVVYRQDRIDRYRLCVLDRTETDSLKITVLKKQGVVRLDKIAVYDSSSYSDKGSFLVSEYMTIENGKLEKNIDNPDFTGYFDIIDDIILFGEIAVDDRGNIRYGEGKDDFANDVALVRRIKPDINIVVDINI